MKSPAVWKKNITVAKLCNSEVQVAAGIRSQWQGLARRSVGYSSHAANLYLLEIKSNVPLLLFALNI